MFAIRLAAPAIILSVAGSSFANPTAIVQNSGFGANSFADAGQTLLFESFDRPGKSGTGSKWIMLARNTGPSASDAMYIVGEGTSYNLVALEGTTQFVGADADQFFSTADRYVDINENGDWVGIGNLNGGSTSNDEVVYTGNFDGSFTAIAAAEGQSVGAGDTLGTGNYGPGITDSGDISFGYSRSTGSLAFYTNNGNTRVLAEGDAIAGGIFDSPFSGRNAFQTTSDGSSYVLIGEAPDGTPALVKDGAAVLSEGDNFGGKIVDAIRSEQNILQDNGDWLARVTFTDGTGGAIKNGSLIAQDGDLVGGQFAGERWTNDVWTSSSATTFAMVTGDSAGNVVLGGFTDNADSALSFVWTYNGQEFMRSGDQIDIDGDGSLDDAFIYIASFSTASPSALGGFLADDGYFYSVIDWTNAAGTLTGEAFVRVAVPAPGATGLLALAGLAAARRRR